MSGDLLGHVAEAHTQPQDIHVPAAATATLAPAVAPLVFRRALSPLKPVLLLNSASRKRLKLQKPLPRPRTPATLRLQPRVPHLLISRARKQITQPGRAALPLHLNPRRDLEHPQRASLSPLTGRPRGPRSTRPAETEMERGRTTLCIGTRGKHQHPDKEKTRNEPLLHSSPLCHRYHYP